MALLFCYGTLKLNHRRNFYLHEGVLLGEVMAPGFTLYRGWFSDYPVMVPRRGCKVLGELWDVPERVLLEVVDGVEGVRGGLFRREKIFLSDGRDVYAYLGDRPFPFWTVGASWPR